MLPSNARLKHLLRSLVAAFVLAAGAAAQDTATWPQLLERREFTALTAAVTTKPIASAGAKPMPQFRIASTIR